MKVLQKDVDKLCQEVGLTEEVMEKYRQDPVFIETVKPYLDLTKPLAEEQESLFKLLSSLAYLVERLEDPATKEKLSKLADKWLPVVG